MFANLSAKIIYSVSASVLLAGLLLTFQWQQQFETNNREQLEAQVNKYASKAYLSLQQALVRESERLDSLAAAFKLTDSMSYQEFLRFAKVVSISAEHVQSLQWIKIIETGEKKLLQDNMKAQGFERFQIHSLNANQSVLAEQMAVIKYIYPLPNNQNQLGLDIYSNEQAKEAAYIADITQSPISMVSVPEDNKQSKRVTIFHPIYGANGLLRGFAVLVMDMQRLIDYVINKNLLEKSLQWFIRDNYSKQTLYGEHAAEDGHKDLMKNYEFYMPFNGRSWSLTLTSDLTRLPEFNKQQFQGFPSNWTTGIAISLILGLLTYLFLMLRYRSLQTEKTIRDNEKQYQELIKQSSEGFLLLNRDGYILDVNSETCKMLGYKKQQLIEKHLSDIDTENDFFQAKSLCFSIMPKDKLLFETTFQKKRGTRITVEISASRIIMSGKEVIGAFVRDLTERLTYRALSLDNKQLQEALQQHTQELEEQKNTFEALFEKSADGIFIFSGKTLMDCNQSALDMFCYDDKLKFFATNPDKLMPKNQPDGENSIRKAKRMLEICLLEGRHRFEWLCRKATGEEFWCDVVVTQIEYFGSPVIHMAMRDISIRKRLEAQMENARAEAVYANQVKTEFVAKMSHEIRTPLHGILNYARMGEERIQSVSTAKLLRYFNHIKISAERLLVLFNDLLDSAKLDHGSMSYDFKYQNLQPVVENCIAEQSDEIKRKQIQLELNHLDYMAYFDQHRIEQVISNLLSNAIRYTPQGGSLVIQAESPEDDTVTLSVRDSGRGVSKQQMESIFETFVHDRNHLLNQTGSGLGLAICREIIKAHHGKIWVENWQLDNEVRGAVFKFTLPLTMSKKFSISA